MRGRGGGGGATRGGNDDVRIGSQLRKLSLHGVPAHQDSRPQVGVPPQLFDNLGGLQGQLAGGGEDDGAGPGPRGVLLQPAKPNSLVVLTELKGLLGSGGLLGDDPSQPLEKSS